jgi:RHS repeat-associated protein
VGNITKRANSGFSFDGEGSRSVEHNYGYDNLYRLTSASGTYETPAGTHTYTNAISYDSINNMMTKAQASDFEPSGGVISPVPGQTYTYSYGYSGSRPHAVTSTGSYNYGYDANGNMIIVTAPGIGTVRALTWDDENRLTRTIEGGSATDYVYDDAGKRVIKKSGLGEVLYVNENYSVRNGDVASCHIFAGNTRVATTMKAPGADESVYYYHGDHLGSSSVVTSGAGAFHEGLEYFPYGETWVHASASPGNHSMPYRFTGKEQDPETGLYYFGARYYDARLSKWISTDPALGKYLPGAGKGNDDLPGMGGVFNPVNMSVYHYGGNNPLVYIDPDGKKIYLVHRELNLNPKKVTDSQKEASVRSTRRIAAHAFIATSIDGNKVDYVASWNGRGINDISQWNQSQDFIDMETDVAGYALIAGKATALTSDDVLDPYIAKAEMMLIQDGSPSFHKFGRWSTCQEESARLLITAMQVYEEETGKTYKGLTERGIESVNFNQHYRLSDHEFNELYYKVQDPANY